MGEIPVGGWGGTGCPLTSCTAAWPTPTGRPGGREAWWKLSPISPWHMGDTDVGPSSVVIFQLWPTRQMISEGLTSLEEPRPSGPGADTGPVEVL